MSTFEPLHEHHAIEQVTFTLEFTPGITWSEHQELRGAHPRWADIVPGVQENTGSMVALVGAAPSEPPPPPPLEFQRFNPAGTLDWRLLLIGPKVAAQCRSYKHWQQVWDTVRTLFVEAGDLLKQPDRQITSMALEYSNAFLHRGTAGDADAGSVLKADCPHLPRTALHHGPSWHAYAGWFTHDGIPAGQRLLRRMHIDAGVRVEGEAVLKLTNFVRLDSRVPFPASKADLSDRLDHGFDLLHSRAKAILTEYLTEQMVQRIQLHAP